MMIAFQCVKHIHNNCIFHRDIKVVTYSVWLEMNAEFQRIQTDKLESSNGGRVDVDCVALHWHVFLSVQASVQWVSMSTSWLWVLAKVLFSSMTSGLRDSWRTLLIQTEGIGSALEMASWSSLREKAGWYAVLFCFFQIKQWTVVSQTVVGVHVQCLFPLTL